MWYLKIISKIKQCVYHKQIYTSWQTIQFEMNKKEHIGNIRYQRSEYEHSQQIIEITESQLQKNWRRLQIHKSNNECI